MDTHDQQDKQDERLLHPNLKTIFGGAFCKIPNRE